MKGRPIFLASMIIALVVLLVGLQTRQGSQESSAHSGTLAPLPVGAVAVPCPLNPRVILAGGQSNGANRAGSPTQARPGIPAFMWFAGQCYLAQDPLPGVTGRGGSVWVPLIQKLAGQEDQPYLLIPQAFGGTRFEQWYEPESPHFSRLSDAAQAAAEAGFKIETVLWFQGESDAEIDRSVEGHAEEIAQLMARMQAELPIEPEAPLILIPATLCSLAASEGSPSLRKAFQRVASRNPQVILGPSTDDLGSILRSDGCHFNDAGRDAVVARLLQHLDDTDR